MSPWRTVAAGIVNRTTSPTVPAFAKTAPFGYGALVRVVLVVAREDDGGDPIRVVGSITGRNTQGNHISDVCDIPS